MSEKPEVDFTPGPAPTELVIEDVTLGEGDEAVPGGVVDVHYVGVDFETGEQFDSSWDRGQSARFPLPQLIGAWQQGRSWPTARPAADIGSPAARSYS